MADSSYQCLVMGMWVFCIVCFCIVGVCVFLCVPAQPLGPGRVCEVTSCSAATPPSGQLGERRRGRANST